MQLTNQKRNKIVILSFVALILFAPFLSVASVGADPLITVLDLDASGQTPISALHPSSNASNSAVGNAFTALNTAYVTSINMELWAVGNNEGNIQAIIEGISGSVAADTGIPNGIISDVSTNVVAMNVLDKAGPEWYTFTFDGQFRMLAGYNYTVYAQVVQATNVAQAQYIYSETTSTAGVNAFTYHNSGWDLGVVGGTGYISMQIYGTSSPTATATPVPTPTIANPTPGAGEDSVSFYTNLLMPVAVPLLIILICACLGAYFMGKWGFFLGLNVGVILTYVALPYWMPLWGVVLIGVADVLVLLMTRGN